MFALVSLTASLLGCRALAQVADPFTFYDMPTPLAGPCDLCEGPDGAEWVQDLLVNKVARVDPTSGVVEEYEIPFTLPATPYASLPNVGGRVVLACAIQPGSDGNIYAANGLRNQLARINVTTRQIDVFTPPPFDPLGDLQPFNDMYRGPTGMFFTQTTANVVTHFDYVTEKFTNYPVPTPEGSPLGIFVASDGYAYFAEFLGQKLGRLNAATGEITEFSLPPSLLGPAVIRVETENRYIWFTAFLGNGIGRFDTKTGGIASFTNPSPASFPAEDTLDSDGNIWFSTATQNVLNILSQNGTFSQIVQPGTDNVAPVSLPLYIDIGIHYGPGDAIWFTEATSNRVGSYRLS